MKKHCKIKENKLKLTTLAFTLIELLAIIVILAIIAVITIPIILNVIENARKGSAIDSAYGYKDAVIKYYVSNMLENQDLKLEDFYTIDEYGKLLGETEQYNIPTSGATPSGGYLIITNNSINDGCLTIGDYKVTLEDGNATAEKGQCKSLSLTACDSPLFHPTDDKWFDFTTSNGKITITRYTGSATDVTIPCTIGGDEVVNINATAFVGKSLENVVINDNIETIGSAAFVGNGLVNVKLGVGVKTIDGSAFMGNNLTSIIIPDNVTDIGDNAFGNNQLEIIKLGSKVSIIGSNAFVNSNLTYLEIPDSVTDIGTCAFAGNQLGTIKLGSKVSIIGNSAFGDNKLISIDIPNSVSTIGDQAFAGNQLEVINLGSGITSIGSGAFSKRNSTSGSSNPKLSTIINKSKTSFDWNSIIDYEGDDDTLTCKTGSFRTMEEDCYGVTITDK